MREQASPQVLVTAALACAVGAACALLLAGGNNAPGGPPVRLLGGVPVGVEHTPAGALAAADNYVALASQSIEQDPAQFAALLSAAYTPQARARTQTQAQRIRGADPQNTNNYKRGGRGVAIVAARRLDAYTRTSARVTSWLAGFVWGPGLSPRQTWNLVETVLSWHSGRWLVAAMDTSATPAPVPSVVYVDGENNRTAAFARLHGMSAPFYGTAE